MNGPPSSTRGSPESAGEPDEQLREGLFDAARTGDVDRLVALLDARPELLHARAAPYGMTLLHLAARHAAAVDLLLERGLDVNSRESGDDTCAMHWAAAAGSLDAVRRLADAGGDVVGDGDDHELGVMGWATCWPGAADDAAQRAVADFLVSRGARHHIFSAIALQLGDEVRRIAAADPAALERRMSRNENHQRPLHFAVRLGRRDMVALLVDLGADPLGSDASGYPPAAYATTPDVDRPVLEAIRARGAATTHAAQGSGIGMDLLVALALADWRSAQALASAPVHAAGAIGPTAGVLHLMAKRGDAAAVAWLLSHGADPNARWDHWDASVTPLHLATLRGHEPVVRLLLDAGGDPTIRDSKHEADPIGWAEFFGNAGLAALMKTYARPR